MSGDTDRAVEAGLDPLTIAVAALRQRPEFHFAATSDDFAAALRALSGSPRSDTRIEDQPPPIPNDDVPVWDLVIKDMQDRDRTGRERYGTPLQVDNGRDHLVDAYQEGLDLVVYLRAEIERRR